MPAAAMHRTHRRVSPLADAHAGVRARRVGPSGSLLRVVVRWRGTVAHGLVGGAHTGDESCEPQADHAWWCGRRRWCSRCALPETTQGVFIE